MKRYRRRIRVGEKREGENNVYFITKDVFSGAYSRKSEIARHTNFIELDWLTLLHWYIRTIYIFLELCYVVVTSKLFYCTPKSLLRKCYPSHTLFPIKSYHSFPCEISLCLFFPMLPHCGILRLHLQVSM